jgi:tRNA guanosine-2'-O-methyltransferase
LFFIWYLTTLATYFLTANGCQVALSHERLRDLVLDCLPRGSDDAEYQYALAEICLSNAQLAGVVFCKLTKFLIATRKELHPTDHLEDIERGVQSPKQELLHKFRSYLRFLKCSYWLPSDRYHYVTPDLLELFISCIGNDILDADAHDTLSALLDLLTKSPVVVLNHGELPEDWLAVPSVHGNPTLNPRMFDDVLFERFKLLPFQYFSDNAAKAFRTWFQWISHASTNSIEIKALHSPFYWSVLQNGLVSGFADQRKYCLGILRTTLLLPRQPIDLPQMVLDPDRRLDFIAQYNRYSTLFEIIVLDRYANQVQACLPDLSSLLGPASLITADWSTALLSAALNPKVQDGIRKLVGNWYLDHVIEQQGSISAHATFLVEGLLPWATLGSLLTSSLTSTRSDTSCTHGTAIADLVTRFIVDTHSEANRREVFAKVLGFIINTEGKIFSPSVLFLLEGLLQGLKTRPLTLGATEFELMLRVSRLPALPEIGTDLCSIYFAELSRYVDPELLPSQHHSAYVVLKRGLDKPSPSRLAGQEDTNTTHGDLMSLSVFNKRLEDTRHKSVQDANFGPACSELIALLDKKEQSSLLPSELFRSLESLWQEADRQDFPRAVVASITPLLFHPVCAYACAQAYVHSEGPHNEDGLATLLSIALVHLQKMAQGRPYVLSILATSVRRASFSSPSIMGILPLCSTLLHLINSPPTPQKEFLFEVAAAQKLQKYVPERGYAAYYGQREWIGFAATIDMLNRIPDIQLNVARELMDRLLEPWRTQKAPIPIISKWKNVMQLQAMLLLTESCVNEENADTYLDAFMHALIPEQWPRFRYLLEWIIARIYFHFPGKTSRILDDLAKLDENSPAHIASLIRISILCAPFKDSEEFALKMMIWLIPLSASPKVQVRHEAHWSFPTLFDLSIQRSWTSITENPAFRALDDHVRSLDKFIAPPSTIRTLKLDVVKDFTITNIFQGRYLNIETPELERVAHEDFIELYHNDSALLAGVNIPAARIALGDPMLQTIVVDPAQNNDEPKNAATTVATEGNPTFFQTKSGFDIASLLPTSGPPSAQQKRPTSVILIASLIDNPTNLGGLSRISESFGLEALYIDDLRKIAHKDFKATSVTSEKHLPINELKIPEVPGFIMSLKRQGYEVVGIEQTDRSGVLGEADQGVKDLGTLPKKCVLVLGSERGGISSEVLAVLDRCVEIRTVGVTRSLNVQTAGGIAVYEWWREWGRGL